MLSVLALVPALVAGYFYLLRRQRESALKYASLSMVKEAMGRGQKFRRHIPPLLFLIALIALIVATARPAAVVSLPSRYQTIILAMDVSGSMRAVDVQPSRLAAAQAAAKAFVADQPANVRIGVVSFAATASLVQNPTQQPRGHRRGHRPLSIAARHRHRQRHYRFTGNDFPRRRHRRKLVYLWPQLAARHAPRSSGQIG